MPQSNPNLEITVRLDELQAVKGAIAHNDLESAIAFIDDMIALADEAKAALKRAALSGKAKPKPKKANAGPLIAALEEVTLARDVGRLSKKTLAACEAKGISPESLVKARARVRREGAGQ